MPIVVILWDYVFLQPNDVEGGAWRGRWPLYAALAGASLLLAYTAPGARTRTVGLWLDGWTPWTYLLTQSRVIVNYVRLAFWPSPLVLDPYWTPVRSLAAAAWPMAALSLALGLCLLGLVGRARALRHAQPAAFAGACFFLLLAPTSSVLPIATEVAAEHRMYLPLAALISLAVVSAHRSAQWFAHGKGRDDRPFRAHSVAGVLVLVVLTMALATATRARNLDYASDEAIWRDTIAKQPENARARTALGADLVAAGRYQEAEVELRESLALDPHRAETLSNLGAAEFALGRIDASIAHLEEAVALRPDFIAAHRNLGAAYRARGRDAEAAAHLRRVLDAQPDHPIVLKDLALLLAVTPDSSLRNGDAALSLAQRAVTLTSRRDPASLAAMGAAYAELGRFDEAVATLREAVTLSANNPALAAQLSHLQTAYAAHQTRPAR